MEMYKQKWCGLQLAIVYIYFKKKKKSCNVNQMCCRIVRSWKELDL